MEVKIKSKSRKEGEELSYSSEKKCFEDLLRGGPRKCFDNYKEIMEREVKKINPNLLTELRCLALLAQKEESSSYLVKKILSLAKNMVFLSNGETSNEFYSAFPFLEFVEKTKRGKRKKVVLNRNSLTYLFLFSLLSLKRREKKKNLSISMVRVINPNTVNYHKNLLNYNVLLLRNKRLKNKGAMLKNAKIIDLHNQKEQEILEELEKSLEFNKESEDKDMGVVLEPLRISIFRSLALCYLNYQVTQLTKTSKVDVEGFIELVNFTNTINKKLLKERKSSSKNKEEKLEDLLIYVPLIALSEKEELKERIEEYKEKHKGEGLRGIKYLEEKKAKVRENVEFERMISIYRVIYL